MARVMGVRQRFVKAAMNAPFLGREEEHDLAVRWKAVGDQDALHRLASAHIRLVIAIAARFKHYNLPMADLIQEGHVGLLEAAARFDPEREVRFSTYATWWIRAAIQDYVLRNWSIVRGGTSSAQKALFFNLRRMRARLAQRGEDISTSQLYQNIAETIGVSVNDVAMMDARLSGHDMSLNAPMSDPDSAASSERQDFLVWDGPAPDEQAGEEIDRVRRAKWLRAALAVLSEREMRILRERRLVDNASTLEALGSRLGISKERVRQIETRAIEKLRQALDAQQPDARTAMI
ncbi:RNA polymerase factor sigma-32 [Blastochloris viridis]|uniref:RNA polymerase sigma factor RpoH-related protein n=1 Tax=Blastochloris viridis TaxID=1079 RepID=A0A0H5B9K6_BLAVI|nr:RNA polymerase factor sigma-32 [Blastochloris viridis]ALK07860.1 RNA polymerase sigma factor RpoH [Blastochloris viridis]BAR98892.1 RNA polymerase sigma factor RpoH-related protein [Blastochloris viridis]CUU43782.1 RNA polymerase sigma-32 factor [Blastochloris viridis]